MKKILVLGSRGMAGHTIVNYFKKFTSHNITEIARTLSDYNLDVETNLNYLTYLIKNLKIDIIINCIGILLPDSTKNISRTIYINSFFPHWLEEITKNTNTKIIHLSTNCIFKEDRGNYLDTDIPDGEGWYAKTKALGEIVNNKEINPFIYLFITLMIIIVIFVFFKNERD